MKLWKSFYLSLTHSLSYTFFSSQSWIKQRAVCISSNNLEHVSGCISRVRSGLFAAEPATDYLVKQLNVEAGALATFKV